MTRKELMAMQQLSIVDHPLVRHKITLLRDKNTGTKEFRELVKEISGMIFYEASRTLPEESCRVITPIAETSGSIVSDRLTVVPIMRAGLAVCDSILNMVPTAKVGHIGMYRNEESLEPVEYYCKMPDDLAKSRIFVLDPMLATGGTAVATISKLKELGGQQFTFLCIIAAPEGVERLIKVHPDVRIYAGDLDDHLTNQEYIVQGYIVPGLGDAGDRIYGTK